MIIHREMTLDELLGYYAVDAMVYNAMMQRRRTKRTDGAEGRETTRLHRQRRDSERQRCKKPRRARGFDARKIVSGSHHRYKREGAERWLENTV